MKKVRAWHEQAQDRAASYNDSGKVLIDLTIKLLDELAEYRAGDEKRKSDHETELYNHILKLHRKLLDHSWSRQQTVYDSKFIAYMDKELTAIGNEAYMVTNG